MDPGLEQILGDAAPAAGPAPLGPQKPPHQPLQPPVVLRLGLQKSRALGGVPRDELSASMGAGEASGGGPGAAELLMVGRSMLGFRGLGFRVEEPEPKVRCSSMALEGGGCFGRWWQCWDESLSL